MIWKLKNITKGSLSTIVGTVLIVSSIASVFVTDATWLEISPIVILGLGLLGINEKDFMSKTNNNLKK
jgi:hypothetical protein